MLDAHQGDIAVLVAVVNAEKEVPLDSHGLQQAALQSKNSQCVLPENVHSDRGGICVNVAPALNCNASNIDPA